MFEVELKFRLASLADLREKLVGMQAEFRGQNKQVDEYFDDPLRDFSSLDYALRIRRVNDQHRLTFKGPNLDSTAKMRHEVELPLLDAASAQQMKEVFLGIGFLSVAKVEKCRETMSLVWSGIRVEICLDHVEGLGEFAELEIVAADHVSSEAAKQHLLALASVLGLKDPIITSYLDLILQERESTS